MPRAPLIMSQLLLHSPLLIDSSHRRMTKQVPLKLGKDLTTEEEEEGRGGTEEEKRREEWSVLLFSSAQRCQKPQNVLPEEADGDRNHKAWRSISYSVNSSERAVTGTAAPRPPVATALRRRALLLPPSLPSLPSVQISSPATPHPDLYVILTQPLLLTTP